LVNVGRLLACSVDLAEQAGELIRTIYNAGPVQAIDKSQGSESKIIHDVRGVDVEDPQTVADLRAQKLLIGSLHRLMPKLCIIGEEGDLEIDVERETVIPRDSYLDSNAALINSLPKSLTHVPMDDIVVWVGKFMSEFNIRSVCACVCPIAAIMTDCSSTLFFFFLRLTTTLFYSTLDPIDGTKEFTMGNLDAVTVLLGISVRGKAIAGVVHTPFTKRTVYGCVGVGAFGDIHRDMQRDATRDGITITTSRSHLSEEAAKFIESLNPANTIKLGGAGNKGIMVLENKADAYIFPQLGTKKWDTCALDAILCAAGGKLSDAFGRRLTYDRDVQHMNSRGVLASMNDHSRYVMSEPEK
jgi:3'(2'), 5'-bisphosphate nucleotidase